MTCRENCGLLICGLSPSSCLSLPSTKITGVASGFKLAVFIWGYTQFCRAVNPIMLLGNFIRAAPVCCRGVVDPVNSQSLQQGATRNLNALYTWTLWSPIRNQRKLPGRRKWRETKQKLGANLIRSLLLAFYNIWVLSRRQFQAIKREGWNGMEWNGQGLREGQNTAIKCPAQPGTKAPP